MHHQQPGGVSVGRLPQEHDREHGEHTREPAACETRDLAKETRGSAKEPRGSAEETRDSAKETRDSGKEFPFFHLRASEKRRAKPSLRRKRVATMRSVNGWVRNADPTSTRREVSLDRRINALRRGGKRTSSSQPEVTASHIGKYGRRHGSRASNGAFLTEVDSNGNPIVEIHRGKGHGAEHSGGSLGANRDGKRRGSGRVNKGKPFRVGGSDLSEGTQAGSNAAGAGGRYGSAKLGRRAQPRSGTTIDRGQVRVGQARRARTVPVAAPQRQQQHRRRDETRGVLRESGAIKQVQNLAEQGSISPTREFAERDERSENLDVGDALRAAAEDVGGQAPSDPREALDTARVWGREDGTLTVR